MATLTTKGRYATRLLVYLASRQAAEPAKKKDIAEAEGITPDYVEQILIRLKAAGLVRSHRGKEGGFSLAVDPQTLTVARVLEVMEGRMTIAPCDEGACRRAESCPTRELWKKLDRSLMAVLTGTTIGELAEKNRSQSEFDI